MANITRRGFFRLGAAVVGGAILARYAEPLIHIPESVKWIEDAGDFVIIRVPDHKTFANEIIRKPVVFMMGQSSIVRNVDVTGFVNIIVQDGGLFSDSRVDGSQMVTEDERPLVHIMGTGLNMQGSHLIAGPHNSSVFRVEGPRAPGSDPTMYKWTMDELGMK